MQLTIRLPEDHVSKLDKIAISMGLKKSDITRMAIKRFIEAYEEKEAKPYSKVQSILGIVESGVPDLGQNHRKYLVDKIKAGKK